jgi:hypothetical protein
MPARVAIEGRGSIVGEKQDVREEGELSAMKR